MTPDPAFDATTAAKKLLREGRSGALASLLPGSGDPYCSLVNVATAADGAPLLPAPHPVEILPPKLLAARFRVWADDLELEELAP